MMDLLDLFKQRRSIYNIGKNTEYSIDEIVSRIRDAVAEAPSAFNSQTTRVVIITGEANDKHWDIIHDAQKSYMPAEMWERVSPRFENAKQGLGTVLIFEDRDEVAKMPTNELRATLYKEQNAALVELIVGLTLTEMNLGTSLQHHNIGYEQGFDKPIREALGLPDSYELNAQMPFGSIEQEYVNKPRIDKEIQTILIDKL